MVETYSKRVEFLRSALGNNDTVSGSGNIPATELKKTVRCSHKSTNLGAEGGV